MERRQSRAPGKARWERVIGALTGRLHCLSVTYGMTSSSTYYFTKAMTDLFVNTAGDGGVKFQSISTMADFWSVSHLVMVFIHFQHGGESLNHNPLGHCMCSYCESPCPVHHYVYASVLFAF